MTCHFESSKTQRQSGITAWKLLPKSIILSMFFPLFPIICIIIKLWCSGWKLHPYYLQNNDSLITWICCSGWFVIWNIQTKMPRHSNHFAVSSWVIVFVKSSRTTKALFQHVCHLLSLTRLPALLLTICVAFNVNICTQAPIIVLVRKRLPVQFWQLHRINSVLILSLKLTVLVAWTLNFSWGNKAGNWIIWGEKHEFDV